MRLSACTLALVVAHAPVLSAAPAEDANASPNVRTAGLAPEDEPARDEPGSNELGPHRWTLGAQAFWVVGKVMPGVVLRFDIVDLLWVDVEGGLVFVTSPPPGSGSFVGSPFAAHLLLAPLRTRRVELGAGLGADVHALWGIHSDIAEVALAVKVSAHFWVTPKLDLFASARVYPIATSGLDLGEFRDGSAGLPVLFATGVAWSLQ